MTADRLHDWTQEPPPGTERRLWFGILAAPVAWTLNELVGVSVVGRVCGQQELSTLQWAVLFGLAAAAAAVALAAGLTAYRLFRRWTPDLKFTHAEGWTRVEFMAMMGVIISGFLLLNIVFFGIMPLFVNPCLRTT
jgi:hypothetical protein